jgi:hypothetical protein
MRRLIDRVARNGIEWRIIARSDYGVEVWTDESILEFPDQTAAYRYVADEYRVTMACSAASDDFQSFAPGQPVHLPIEGRLQKLTVISNSKKAVNFIDAAGKQFHIPHIRPEHARPEGVEHYRSEQHPPAPERGKKVDVYAAEMVTIGFCNKCGEEVRGTSNYTMEDHLLDVHGIEVRQATTPYMTTSNVPDFRDHSQLYRGATEILAAEEGGVFDTKERDSIGYLGPNTYYNAAEGDGEEEVTSKTIQFLAEQAGLDISQYDMDQLIIGFQEESSEHDSTEELDVVGGPVDTLKIVLAHLVEDPDYYTKLRSVMARTADITRTPYYCREDHVRLMPHSPSDARKVCPDCGAVYTAKNVLSARDITAQPMEPGGPMDTGTPNVPEHPDPGGEGVVQPSQEGRSNVGTGRVLSRHELVQEAEHLIYNALDKGVKIGAYDLTRYMANEYGNSPEEIMEAVEHAWKIVQFESKEELPGVGPGGQQQQQQPTEEQSPGDVSL